MLEFTGQISWQCYYKWYYKGDIKKIFGIKIYSDELQIL